MLQYSKATTMFCCYGDESYDETRARVFAVAGVVGTEAMWARLERAWVIRTDGIPFHSKDCESGWGDYKAKSHDENTKLYRDLTGLLAQSGLCGWGFSIDMIAQREVFPEAPDIAYYKGFTEVIEAMTRFAKHYGEMVSFVFDARRESDFNAGLLFKMFREGDPVDDPISQNLIFASAREQPRLQVADLMAREAMKALDNQIGTTKRPPRKSWMSLYATKRFSIDVISRDWFESLREQLPAMMKQSEIDPEHYRKWLQQLGLHHSNTNLFRFIGRNVGRG